MYPGTGLGLAIVKMIVTALGGAVQVESQVGAGTSFSFTLPQAGTAAPVTTPAPASPEPTPAGTPAAGSALAAGVARTRVLVIDDDLDTLALTRLLLPEEDFEVVEAYDAFAGMREFYFHFPDIVLVDALLPLMSGLELCRVIKSHPELGSIPVVILSAAAQEEEIRSGYRVGADAYLVKPFRPQDLLDTVRRLTTRQTD
jgi:CheY-like chemotaxis protein